MTDFVGRVGSEFLVNTKTSGAQHNPAITGLAGGGFVVSWTDAGTSKAQVFESTGLKVGAEFRISPERAAPLLTGLKDGGFVATWSEWTHTEAFDGKAQIYTATGQKVGPKIDVNTQMAANQSPAGITGLANGGFVISWQNGSAAPGDMEGATIKAQVFTATGEKIGTEFLLTPPTGGYQLFPSVSALERGGFVATWEDATETSIKVQVFTDSGQKVGSTLLVTDDTAGFMGQHAPKVTSLTNGGFVVSWADSSGLLGDTDSSGIQAQIFTAAGQKVGATILVNTQTEGNQLFPSIAALEGGGFVVSWTDSSHTLGDAHGSSIKAQVFSETGEKLGSEFLVNTHTESLQLDPDITGLTDGSFVITWSDSSGTLGDTSGSSIKAQIFQVDDGPSLSIEGTNQRDHLNGGRGDDVLRGNGGSDVIDGRAGADTMYGGTRHDVFIVDDEGDRVIEWKDQGTDTVKSSVSFILPDHVERLTLTGAADIDATGNGLDNVLTGNDGRNVIRGGAGADLIEGGRGPDQLYAGVDDATDIFLFTRRMDTFAGAGNYDRIYEFDRSQGVDDTTSDKIDLSAFELTLVDSFSGTGRAEVRVANAGAHQNVWIDLNGDDYNDMLIQVRDVDALSSRDFIL